MHWPCSDFIKGIPCFKGIYLAFDQFQVTIYMHQICCGSRLYIIVLCCCMLALGIITGKSQLGSGMLVRLYCDQFCELNKIRPGCQQKPLYFQVVHSSFPSHYS